MATWVPIGTADFDPYSLSEKDKRHITMILHNAKPQMVGADDFFRDVEFAIAIYMSGSSLAKADKPSVVRDQLQAALTDATALQDKLQELTGSAWYHVNSLNSCTVSDLIASNEAVVRALGWTITNMDKPPTKGRLPEHQRDYLAVAIRDAIEKHFPGVKVSATQDGLFEILLMTVLEIASGKPVSSVHDLARKALKK